MVSCGLSASIDDMMISLDVRLHFDYKRDEKGNSDLNVYPFYLRSTMRTAASITCPPSRASINRVSGI
jgi:hypothetical protein